MPPIDRPHGEDHERPTVVGIGLIRRDGCFLVRKRPEQTVYAGYWEFPGGKCEPGEQPVEAVGARMPGGNRAERRGGQMPVQDPASLSARAGGTPFSRLHARGVIRGASRPDRLLLGAGARARLRFDFPRRMRPSSRN